MAKVTDVFLNGTIGNVVFYRRMGTNWSFPLIIGTFFPLMPETFFLLMPDTFFSKVSATIK